MAGDEDLITIVSPDDMVLGFDPATGMPRAEPTNRATGGTVSSSGQPVVDPSELETIKSRLTAAEQERDNLAALAAAEKAKAEKAQADASTNTDYALRAHWKNINLEHENAYAAYQKATSDHEQLNSWIQATQAFQRQAEADLARAVEAGDAPGQADANKRISTSAAQLVNLEEGKRGAASVIEDKKREVAQKKHAIDDTARRLSALDTRKDDTKIPSPPVPPQTADEFIKSAPEKTREWLSQHREYATPGTKDHQRVQTFAAMYLADKGVDVKNQRSVNEALNSDDFRGALDAKFFPSKEPAMDNEVKISNQPQAGVVQQQPRQQAPAAPVSRTGTPGSPSTGAGRITLTQDQFNHAPEIANATLWETFDPDLKQRFGQWSETAARFQYDRWHKKAQVERPHRLVG